MLAAQDSTEREARQVGGQGELPVPWGEVWPHTLEQETAQPAGPLAKNLRNWPGASSGFPQSQLVALPRFRNYLAHPMVLGIAHAMLDDHVRLLHIASRKTIPSGATNPGSAAPANGRGYHSDWPHDLASLVNVRYSEDDRFGDSGTGTSEERRPYHHCGALQQPFPDACFCLSTIWLLSRSGPDCGGTFVVPGSHRDPRNPRSTVDGIDGLSNELRSKLARIQPQTLGQAGRIDGMTPAALTLLLMKLRQAERRRA